MTNGERGGGILFLQIGHRGMLSDWHRSVKWVLRDLANIDEPLANPPVVSTIYVPQFRQLVIALWVLFSSKGVEAEHGFGGRVK